MSNFCTTVFTSDRQHWNLLDIDKITISDTLSKSSLIRNSYKLCHIKVTKPEEDIWKDKKQWFEARGFQVIETIGDWTNDSVSHGNGIIADMARVYSVAPVLSNEFVLHLESDWVFNVDNLDDYLYEHMNILSKNQYLIYSRDTRIDNPNKIKDLNAQLYYNNHYLTNTEFSFNPFVARTRDLKYISNFVAKNQIHGHCEKAYEIAAKYLTNNEYIFNFTNNQIVQHRGDQLDREWYENKLKELNK